MSTTTPHPAEGPFPDGSGFTRGPWRRDEFDRLRSSDGKTVEFRGMHCFLSGSVGRLDQAKANTRLADAAPEMFEALRELVNWYGKRDGGPMDELLPANQQEPEVANAMAALSRAGASS